MPNLGVTDRVRRRKTPHMAQKYAKREKNARMEAEITIDAVREARRRVARAALVTPVMPSTSFSQLAGRDVWLKAENLQRTCSFKIRGALNAIGLLPPEAATAGVVAASAGNHAQGVALAAAEYGLAATVIMPVTAALPKIEATRSYGAEVRLAGEDLGAAVDVALEFAADTGATFVHPYDDPDIVAGQGTLGLELLEQLPDAGTVVIPVGGGGLISGVAIALKEHNPSVRIVGVQSAAVSPYVAARRTGRPDAVSPSPTVADGIAVARPAHLCFEVIERLVDDLIVVDDARASEAVALLLERAKLLVEPSGAVTVSAILADQVGAGSGPVVAVLSGGNIDLLLLDSLVRHGLEARGRYSVLRIRVPDQPGRLADALNRLGERGANILSVDHHREGVGLPLGMVEIRLAMETRGTTHFDEILASLDDAQVIGSDSGLGRGSSG